MPAPTPAPRTARIWISSPFGAIASCRGPLAAFAFMAVAILLFEVALMTVLHHGEPMPEQSFSAWIDPTIALGVGTTLAGGAALAIELIVRSVGFVRGWRVSCRRPTR